MRFALPVDHPDCRYRWVVVRHGPAPSMDPTDPEDSSDPTDLPDSANSADSSAPTAAERACFEAGIKFGSLYHQFAGTPVSATSAASLEHAIEEAIENQPHCEQVTVDIDTDALAAEIAEGSATYTELTGRFMEVTVVVEREGHEVVAEMAMEDGYPLMSIASVDRADS